MNKLKFGVIFLGFFAWAEDVDPELINNLDMFMEMELLEGEDGLSSIEMFAGEEDHDQFIEDEDKNES